MSEVIKDIILWRHDGVVVDSSVDIAGEGSPGENFNLGTFTITHFYYYGIENVGLNLEYNKSLETLTRWASAHPGKGLYVVTDYQTTRFENGIGIPTGVDREPLGLIGSDGNALSLETGQEFTFSLILYVPTYNKKANVMDLILSVSYKPRIFLSSQ